MAAYDRGDAGARVRQGSLLLAHKAEKHDQPLDPGGNKLQVIAGSVGRIGPPKQSQLPECTGQSIIVGLAAGGQLIAAVDTNHGGI